MYGARCDDHPGDGPERLGSSSGRDHVYRAPHEVRAERTCKRGHDGCRKHSEGERSEVAKPAEYESAGLAEGCDRE